jgi:hypothetical protein
VTPPDEWEIAACEMQAACARIALAAAIKSGFGYNRLLALSMHDSEHGSAWLELQGFSVS